jgi:WhiB family redox-sensing transcriptional regulator
VSANRTIPTAWTEESLILPEPWTQEALCAETDPERFFPDKGKSAAPAKEICALCDVAAQCLEYALRNDERFGVWGGKSERERRAMKRRAS